MSKDIWQEGLICIEHGRLRCDICAWIDELKERADIAEKHRDMLIEAFRMMYKYVPETARKEYGFEEFYNTLFPKEGLGDE